MDEEYVTEDQYWNGIRQMATDLKVELSNRPTDMDVTVDLGVGADMAVIAICLAFVVYLLFRIVRDE